MRKATRNGGKKIAPVAVAALVVLYAAPLTVFGLVALWQLSREGAAWTAGFLLLYLLLGGAVIAGILKALRERLREIDRGEEEDASQY